MRSEDTCCWKKRVMERKTDDRRGEEGDRSGGGCTVSGRMDVREKQLLPEGYDAVYDHGR